MPVVFAACGLHLTYFILMYTMVVVAVMLTGNMVVAFLGCVVFSSAVPLAVSLIQGYFMVFFRTGMWGELAEFYGNGNPFFSGLRVHQQL